jgi:general secretion pathway protein D
MPAQPRAIPSVGGSSFFFDDADVFEVIQTVFGEVLRVNYIIDPSVKGRVNFRTITPIPRDKILSIMEIILRLNGIAVVEESGLYRIIPIGNISKEPAPIRFGRDPEAIELKGVALLQIVPLTFINSSEMAAILTPLLTQGGAIHDIAKKNILIIADTDANVRRLLQVTAMFDVDTYKDASQPKVYVYALQNSKAEHVAKILQQVLLGGSSALSASGASTVKTTTGAAAGPTTPQAGPTASQQPFKPSGTSESLVSPSTKIIADDVANSLVIFASPADYGVVIGAIKQIDTIPRQVMIEAVVAEVDLTDNLTYGLLWNLNVNAQKLKIAPFSKAVTVGGPLGFQQLSQLAAGTFGYTAVDSRGNVRLAIEADATNGKAKILSSPNILVADNREARIQVGSQIPIATSTTSTPLSTTTTTGTAINNTTTSTIQYKDVGTILKVKPQINDSGLISLEISQEVSDFQSQVILGTEQFIITKNEVSTNLIAQDGDTIVIGGLVNEKKNDSRSGIPYLSKIPILGGLFGQTKSTDTRTELLILLTPRVLRNETEANKMTTDYYELFKNVSKEVKSLETHKSAKTPQSSGEKAAPQNNDKPAGKAAAPAAASQGGKKTSEYPLTTEEK